VWERAKCTPECWTELRQASRRTALDIASIGVAALTPVVEMNPVSSTNSRQSRSVPTTRVAALASLPVGVEALGAGPLIDSLTIAPSPEADETVPGFP
jgi:hypothetical protein